MGDERLSVILNLMSSHIAAYHACMTETVFAKAELLPVNFFETLEAAVSSLKGLNAGETFAVTDPNLDAHLAVVQNLQPIREAVVRINIKAGEYSRQPDAKAKEINDQKHTVVGKLNGIHGCMDTIDLRISNLKKSADIRTPNSKRTDEPLNERQM